MKYQVITIFISINIRGDFDHNFIYTKMYSKKFNNLLILMKTKY